MADCVFCKIAASDISSRKVYEDESVLVFHDIEPKAPIHWLVIPKTHLAGAAAVTAENSHLIAHIYEVIAKVTAKEGITHYRVVTNNGTEAGQSVFHLHFHVLAGGVLGGMA